MNKFEKFTLAITAFSLASAVFLSASAYAFFSRNSAPQLSATESNPATIRTVSLEAGISNTPAAVVAEEPQAQIPLSTRPAVPEAEPKPAPAVPVAIPVPAPAPAPQPAPANDISPGAPSRLAIPSIGLDKAVRPVGLTPEGNMDVLDSTTAVGWYKYGAIPGNIGSAVMDAHVFQSFSRLKEVRLGDEIYVDGANGSRSRFRVTEIKVYAYTDPGPLQKIFNRSDKARLNLITCYGQLTADRSTYTHRLVVYAELVD